MIKHNTKINKNKEISKSMSQIAYSLRLEIKSKKLNEFESESSVSEYDREGGWANNQQTGG